MFGPATDAQDACEHPEQLRQRVGADLGERCGVVSVVGAGVRARHPHPSRGNGNMDGGHEGEYE